MTILRFTPYASLVGFSVLALMAWGDVDKPTKFTNNGSIANTRHNLTQSPIGAGSVFMDSYRNNYGEVCVYCHTPHGANTQLKAPLWNRTFNNNTYVTYDTLGSSTITAAITQPGVNSLTCLSCHDGTLAVDSILNMPGSGKYSPTQTAQDDAFLNAWANASGINPTDNHMRLDDTGCLTCHAPGVGAVGVNATDFTLFAIGTNLTNDHPIGIRLPEQRIGDDFNDPGTVAGGVRFYDGDGNGRADPNEIRFYDTGDGPEVECASCHDPHGVDGVGGQFNPTFLRISNEGSAVCQTCHNK